MATPYHLRLVSAERELFSGEVTYVHVAGIDGEMGILAHHLPLVTALKIAPVDVETESGQRVAFAVHGGFIEVGTDGVTILGEVAETHDMIQVERARRALERAGQRLAGPAGTVDRMRAEAALARARARLRVAGVADADTARSA